MNKINRFETKENLTLLEKLIRKKEEEIEILQDELSVLKTAKEHENSKLPILLFKVDTTCDMPEDDFDYMTGYIYYLPDFDELLKYDSQTKYPYELNNTVDLTEYFKKYNIPSHISDRVRWFKSAELDLAVKEIQTAIEEIFNGRKTIVTWEQVKKMLIEQYQNKSKSKTKTL